MNLEMKERARRYGFFSKIYDSRMGEINVFTFDDSFPLHPAVYNQLRSRSIVAKGEPFVVFEASKIIDASIRMLEEIGFVQGEES